MSRKMDRAKSVATANQSGKPLRNGLTSENNNLKCICECKCGQELETLKKEVGDLRSWKEERQQFDDIISDWKGQIEKWMLSKFGFSVTSTVGSASNQIVLANAPQEFVDEDYENNHDYEDDNDKTDTQQEEIVNSLNIEESEDVEITPDLFGHFLLNNDNYEQQSDNGENEQDSDSNGLEEVEEGEVEMDTLDSSKTKLRSRKRKKGNEESDSDTDCFTLTSSSSSDLDSDSDEDEYMPTKKYGKRGRPPGSRNLTAGPKTSTSQSKVQIKQNVTENKADLMKLCRKGKGDIWECTVCGFMLTSMDNMLLHIKYNHSSSTHTCPYCRVVVLCRSPKDAIMHQAQCKIRTAKAESVLKKVVTPVPQPRSVVQAAPLPRMKPMDSASMQRVVEDVNAKVNKFVADLLEPSSTCNTISTVKKATIVSKKTEKKHTPTIVTLSSDSDDDDDDDEEEEEDD